MARATSLIRGSAVRSHRHVLPLAVLLAAATALALLRAAAVVSSPPPATDPGAATAAVVRRFYAAATAALAGDARPLAAVLGGNADDLAGRLAALSSAHPSLRLLPEEIVADGEGAVAWVRLAGGTPGAPLVAHPPAADGRWLDRFRVHDGRVAEVWGATASLEAASVLVRTEVAAPAAATARVGVARLILAPGGEVPALIGPGPLTFAVEAGALRARLDATGRVRRVGDAASETIERGVPAPLAPGDQLAVNAGASVGLRNDGTESATVLVVAVFPPATVAPAGVDNAGLTARPLAADLAAAPDEHPSDAAWPEGVAVRRLGAGEMPLPAGPGLRVELARAALGPAAEVRLFRPEEPVLVAAEGGQAVAVLAGDPAAAVVEPGEGAVAPDGDPVRVRGVGDAPAAALLLTLAPASGE